MSKLKPEFESVPDMSVPTSDGDDRLPRILGRLVSTSVAMSLKTHLEELCRFLVQQDNVLLRVIQHLDRDLRVEIFLGLRVFELAVFPVLFKKLSVLGLHRCYPSCTVSSQLIAAMLSPRISSNL